MDAKQIMGWSKTCELKPGQEVVHEGQRFGRKRTGQLTIGGTTCGSKFAIFNRSRGMSAHRGAIYLQGNKLHIFEGTATGADMLDMNQIKADLGIGC